MSRGLKYSGLLLFSIIFIVGIVACGKSPVQKKLAVIDNIIEEHPDSALRLLQEFPSGSLESRGDSAYYGLLYTYALLKNFFPVDNDSLIKFSKDWYALHGDKRDRLRSAVIYGKTKYAKGDYASAIVAATESAELAEELNDEYWHAKSLDLKADILSVTYHYKEAADYYIKAADYYKKSGKDLNYLFSLLDISRSFLNNQEIDKADSILSKLSGLPLEDNKYIKSEFENQIFRSSLFKNNPGNSYSLASNINISGNQPLNNFDNTYNEIVSLNILNKNYDNALRLLKLMEEENPSGFNKMVLLKTYSIYYLSQNDLPKAYHYLDSSFNILKELTWEGIKETPVSAEREYYNQKAEKERNERTTFIVIFIVSLSVLLLILILSFFIYRLRLRLRDKEIESLMQTVSELKNQDLVMIGPADKSNIGIKETNDNSDSTSKNSVLDFNYSNTLLDLYRQQWDILNNLAVEYFEIGKEDIDYKILIKNINKQLDKLRSPKKIKAIIEDVNKHLNGVIDKLKTECDFLTEKDLQILALIYAGLSPKAICMIIDMTPKTFYSKRTRLIQRIEKYDLDNDNFYLHLLK